MLFLSSGHYIPIAPAAISSLSAKGPIESGTWPSRPPAPAVPEEPATLAAGVAENVFSASRTADIVAVGSVLAIGINEVAPPLKASSDISLTTGSDASVGLASAAAIVGSGIIVDGSVATSEAYLSQYFVSNLFYNS